MNTCVGAIPGPEPSYWVAQPRLFPLMGLSVVLKASGCFVGDHTSSWPPQYIYIYIYIYIAAVVRMMQKVLPCDRIVSLIVSKTDYLQALGGVLNPHVATPTHKLQYTVGINPHSDCFYCLSTRFSCYA